MAQFSKTTADFHMEWGYFKKTTVSATIYFQSGFSGIPTVLLTSEWPSGGVGYVETLKSVSGSGFSVHSGNQADNYYVNWVAIGRPVGVAPLSQGMNDALNVFNALSRGNDATKGDDDEGAEKGGK